MHVIQGSDAHRLHRDPNRETNLGVCDRMTEMQLPEASFEALKALFESDNFSRVRPFRPSQDPYDFIRTARSEGETIVQAFHDQPPKRRGRLSPIVRDVVALANGHGGTVFVGVSSKTSEEVAGVEDAPAEAQKVREDIARHASPPIPISVDVHSTGGKQVIVISVPPGPEKPYAVAPGNIYVRQEGETTLAHRDEIVELVKVGDAQRSDAIPQLVPRVSEPEPIAVQEAKPAASRRRPSRAKRTPTPEVEIEPQEPPTTPDGVVDPSEIDNVEDLPLPRTGVEIVESDERDGVVYHSMRDLRNLKVVHNVTRDSARRLWRYAITQKENQPCKSEDVTWQGERGFWKAYKPRGGDVRFNLVYRVDGDLRVYYGVTEEGMDSEWRDLIPEKHRS